MLFQKSVKYYRIIFLQNWWKQAMEIKIIMTDRLDLGVLEIELYTYISNNKKTPVR